MRNPLLNMRANESRTDDTVKRGDPPVMEDYEGENVPYRGVVDHGVPWDESDARDVPGYLGERPAVVYEEPPREQNPVPVIVVNEAGRERRRMRTVRAVAGGSTGGQARNILGEDEDRSRAKIRNPNAALIYITEYQGDYNYALLNGYPLAQNESYETTTQEPVYAITADVVDAPVNIAIEYSVPL